MPRPSRIPKTGDKQKSSRTPQTNSSRGERKPNPSHVHSRKFSFSLEYWRQIDCFGVGQCEGKWFTSLLEKLSELSKYDVDLFVQDPQTKQTWRFHPIDWDATNIPIQRKDLKWLPEDILKNDTEFPLFQFQITKGTGRFVGFLDNESGVFNVVLLDPAHNIQPAGGKFGYKVNSTISSNSMYTDLLGSLQTSLVSARCSQASCGYASAIQSSLESHTLSYGAITHILTPDVAEKAQSLISQNKVNNHSELFEYGIEFFESEN